MAAARLGRTARGDRAALLLQRLQHGRVARVGAGELAEKVGITPANLSILKNNKAKAVRFSTLAALCRALDCQPAALLEYVPGEEEDE